MTTDALRTDRPSRKDLGRFLSNSGVLSSDWAPTFAALDRALFLPGLMWPYDMGARASVPVHREHNADAWYEAADSDVPIVTQWDDGTHDGPGPGALPTSSSSMPSVVYSLLHDLDVEEGMRVLDVGTGTGETAGALAHRLGGENVTTIEVDPSVSATAHGRLSQVGLRPHVVVGDGFKGHRDTAPYDRILATVGIRSVPPNWIAQTRAGGVILAPWGTLYSNLDAMVRLKVTGDEAVGSFTRSVEFMKLRAQRGPEVHHSGYLSAGPLEGAERTTTDLTEEELIAGRFADLQFVLGLRVPQCRQSVADKRDGQRPVWFYGLADRSWACVMFRDGERHASVWQSGPRRLWDEVAAAYRWWRSQGSPELTRFGLTATESGQYVWLEDPANEPWPLDQPTRRSRA
ncbi:methyltransferase domain-containing protein [Streptomyces sp. OF3]|uniref:Protein-L-isoaspartate O-methyltransferase n=1 Tax=Streptomyces alkaliterrae TaxID=2213162 RepID=A0A7W3WIL1_9ACTN|nr:methyltransferase domain-containing protein [Streptomyces alkaliterrae]MBB1252860.1 methyltransferase domain-containing protein [Streptomyces alkaliterrae]